MALFASKGFKGTTTRAIACAAGVSEAIIFRHFATKEDLYDAIINYTVEKRTEQWQKDESTYNENQDLPTLLHTFAQTFVKRNREDTTFIRLMMYSALEDHKFREKFFAIHRSPWLKTIRKTIEEGKLKGTVHPVDAGLTTSAFFHALLQYCINNIVAKTDPPDPLQDEALISNLVSIFARGLQPVHSDLVLEQTFTLP
jgi:AcrR family transcriptional regulator